MHPASPLVLRTTAPWYAHRWPWLLMLGPAIVVVAGVITGWLAYTQQDAMVVDDYYKRGKTINLDLRRDHVASAQALSVALRYDAAARTLGGQLTSFGKPVTAPFRIQLAHSTQPEKDVTLAAYPDAQGRFAVPLPVLEARLDQFIADGGVNPPGFNPALPEVASAPMVVPW